MRLVSWNVNRATWSHRSRCSTAEEHRRRAWTELTTLGADVALIQEAPPPPAGLDRPPVVTLPRGVDAEEWRSLPGPRRYWCSALAAWIPGLEPVQSTGREPLAVTHQGAYRIGAVPWRGDRLVVVSVYALWDYSWEPKIKPRPRYAETSLHRTLSDLTPLLDQGRSGRVPVVIAGDLNASTQFLPPYREPYRVVHDRLTAFGLRNVSVRREGDELAACPCEDDPCRHVRTLEGPTPYQDDYIYASADVAEAMRLVTVERTEGIEAVSDHYPLVAEID